MALLIEPKVEPIAGYCLLERLGGGGFGEVWKAKAPGGLMKAIKIVHGDVRTLDEDGSHRAGQELRALQRVQAIRHPYLLSIERYDIVDGRLMIVTELADCNLYDRFDHYRKLGQPGIPRVELLRYLREAAEVLDLMNNQHQLQHLDIKPQNLFLIHDHVKVADFGLVKDLQGIRTEVSGGVTPVYAAPETFEGKITPFCDQYSLAIVYEELLTGHRPFAGINMQQLVMQHIKASPNLAPLPHADRPAVAKALAKKPENRHPSCSALIEALLAGNEKKKSAPPPRPTGDSARRPRPAADATRKTAARVSDSASRPKPKGTNVAQSIRRLELRDAKPYRPETPPTMVRVRREEVSQPIVEEPIRRTAPPEFTGNGVLVPAVVVGIGYGGQLALRRLRQTLCERFGGLTAVPQLKLLYIETDPEAADASVAGVSPGTLEAAEVILARLNRASHYLKPRRNGRSLIEGWFDPQWLYRIPRNPVVQGQRALGRLAFGDFYQTIVEKIEALLEEVTNPDALLRADRNTALGVRHNRPRVYIVAGLGGGTGSGMCLDMAYTAKMRLRYLGYDQPHVEGLLLLPRVGRPEGPNGLACANSYAALTELAHYTHPDSRYQCTFDDSEAAWFDVSPPFSRYAVLPWDDMGAPGHTTDGPAQAAHYLASNLVTQFGRTVDAARTELLSTARPTTEAAGATFGCSIFSWPRRALLDCAARRLCEFVIEKWASRDAAAMRTGVHQWIDTEREKNGMAGPALKERLEKAAREVMGTTSDELFERLTQKVTPRGWFGGVLDANATFDFLSRCDEVFGRPEANGGSTISGLVGDAMLSTAEALVKDWGGHLAQFAVALIEMPEFRLAGAEEAVTYLRGELQSLADKHSTKADELAAKARPAYLRLQAIANGPASRRTATEFAELANLYPRLRYHAMLQRQIADVSQTLCNDLSGQLEEIGFCRQRLDELRSAFAAHRDAPPPSAHLLLPANCDSPDDAVSGLLSTVGPEDIAELDRRAQRMVQSQFKALVHVCLSTSNVLANLEPAMFKLAQGFLADRIGDASVAELFFARHCGPGAALEAVRRAFEEAAPPLGDTIGTLVGEVAAVSVPASPGGARFAQLAREAIPDERFGLSDGADDISLYRELPRVPLARLPNLGTVARECYRQVAERDRFPPHTRTDVEEWHTP